ncbi:MAG: histidine phosphatase family protein [Actinobacteria bacterium]|nr:MAG: histidine phosphatase family protein [Actinomycetota bacterium]
MPSGAPAERTDDGRADLSGVFLARHGETDYNLHRRFQGWLAVPLNERGRRQALELAEEAAARNFRALWCSSLLRARQTADIVGERLGLEPHEDPRLAETDSGDWTDRDFAEVQAAEPERFAAFVGADPDFAFPGGESFAHQAERVGRALADIATGLRPALVICHGMVIRLALARLAVPGAGGAPRLPPVANAALIPL